MRLKLCLPLSTLIVVLMVIMGCAQLQRIKEYNDICKGDAECVQKVHAASSAVRSVVSSVPVSGFNVEVVGSVAAGLAAVIAGVVYGRRLKKKKDV